MHWIFWIIVGLIAGAVARMIVPGEVGGGLLMDLVVGLVGAVLGGWIANAFFNTAGAGTGSGYIWSIIISILGAVVLLFLVRLFTGRRTVV